MPLIRTRSLCLTWLWLWLCFFEGCWLLGWDGQLEDIQRIRRKEGGHSRAAVLALLSSLSCCRLYRTSTKIYKHWVRESWLIPTNTKKTWKTQQNPDSSPRHKAPEADSTQMSTCYCTNAPLSHGRPLKVTIKHTESLCRYHLPSISNKGWGGGGGGGVWRCGWDSSWKGHEQNLWSQDQNCMWSNMPQHLKGNRQIQFWFYLFLLLNTVDIQEDPFFLLL